MADSYFGMRMGDAISSGASHIAAGLQRRYELQRQEAMRQEELRRQEAEMARQQAQRDLMMRSTFAAKGIDYDPANPAAAFESMMGQSRTEQDLSRAKSMADIQLTLAKAKEEGMVKPQAAPPGYRWAGDSLEAIPGGPAEIEAVAKTEKKTKPLKDVSGVLEELRGLYGSLEKSGGIVDVNKGTISNVMARMRSSGLGQAIGGARGTEPQSVRNQIKMIRPLLINYIRQASEMGARGLDSEKELEFYLSAATDPTLDLQANLAAIDRLDKAYGLNSLMSGGGGSPMTPAPTAQPSALDPEKAARLAELRRKKAEGTLGR